VRDYNDETLIVCSAIFPNIRIATSDFLSESTISLDFDTKSIVNSSVFLFLFFVSDYSSPSTLILALGLILNNRCVNL
jgi:hypothetical protein